MNERVTYNTPGEAHELTFSTSGRVPVLQPDEVKAILIQVLDESRQRFNFEIWAYVVMLDHVHMLVFPREQVYDIDQVRQDIKKRSAFRAIALLRESRPDLIERITLREGSKVRTRFWQDGKGYDRNVTSKKALKASIQYIHENPVRKGLCESPIDWYWSSARQFETGEEGPLRVDVCGM